MRPMMTIAVAVLALAGCQAENPDYVDGGTDGPPRADMLPTDGSPDLGKMVQPGEDLRPTPDLAETVDLRQPADLTVDASPPAADLAMIPKCPGGGFSVYDPCPKTPGCWTCKGNNGQVLPPVCTTSIQGAPIWCVDVCSNCP